MNHSFNAEITNLERLDNSPNGNPRYRVTVAPGVVYASGTDASANYDLPNFRPDGAPVPVRLTLDSWDRVIGVSER